MRHLRVVLASALALVLPGIAAAATPGTLDPSLGGTGLVRYPLDPAIDASRAVAVQTDGKIVAAGDCQNGAYVDFFVARYNANGSPDNSFGAGGRTLVHFGDESVCNAVKIQSDGKIVAGGYTTTANGYKDFAVARLLTDGRPDSSFGLYGQATASISTTYDFGMSLAIQSDSRILLAGYSTIGSTNNMSIVRFTSSGSLDASFSGDGKLNVTVAGSRANAIYLQESGQILMAGSYTSSGVDQVMLVRCNIDGALDTSFDGDGKLFPPIFGVAECAARIPSAPVAISEQIVFAGEVSSPARTIFVARYNLNGTPDTGFDGDGVAIKTFSDWPSVYSVTVSGGALARRFTVAGTMLPNSGAFPQVFAARFLGNGPLDTAFDGDGITYARPGEGSQSGTGMVLDSQARLVIATSGLLNQDIDLALIRFTSSGALDPNFDGDGIRTDNIGFLDAPPGAVAIQPDGRIVMVGGGYAFAVARALPDGQLDSTFAGRGYLRIMPGGYPVAGNALALQSDGKIVVAGTAGSGQNSQIAVARLTMGGRLDSTFSGDGILQTAVAAGWNQITGVAIQPDGKILMTGDTDFYDILHQVTYTSFMVARLNPNGTFDSSFGTGGVSAPYIATFVVSRGMALQPDGRIVIVGQAVQSNQTHILLARYTGTGALDTSFGGTGIVMTGTISDGMANAVRLQPDGKVLVAGQGQLAIDDDYLLLRYNPNGTPDTSFDGDGMVSTPISGLGGDMAYTLDLLPNGRIVAAGRSLDNLKDVCSAVCYNADGSLNAGFGSGGKVLFNFGSPSDVVRGAAIDAAGRVVLLANSGGLLALARLIGDDVSGVANPDRPTGLEPRILSVGPNPFAASARIAYRLTRRGPASLRVFSVSGALVSTLADGEAEPGEHEAVWTGRDGRGIAAAAGVYFVHLEAEGKASNRRVVLVR